MGEEAACAYLGDSLGDIHSHLGGRGKVLKLIVFLPPYSFLPLCLQAKVKSCLVSHVSNKECTSKAGKVGKRAQSEGKRSALCFVADYKIRKSLYRDRRRPELPQSRCVLLTSAGLSVNKQGGEIPR